MKELPEALGKELLAGVNVPVPAGQHVFDTDESIDISPPAVVKAQVPVSSRGHKGGIRFADSVDEIRTSVSDLMGASIGDQTVSSVLVEERVDVREEYYIAVSADGSDRYPTLILSFRGGQDIEEIPDADVCTRLINPMTGIQPYHVRAAVDELSEDSRDIPTDALREIATAMWTVFIEHDLRLLEINPLGLTDDGVVAMDAKPVIDDHASFRQDHEIVHSSLSELEREADQNGIDLRIADGRVGIVSNGAGLGLATLDMITELADEEFAGFIDTHGVQFRSEDIAKFIEYMERAGADVILFNIMAPFLDSEVVSEGLTDATRDGMPVPIVARFKGLNDAEAIEQCDRIGIRTATEIPEAIDIVQKLLTEVGA